ncbi:hypothetical protein PYCCODRAFT_902896 [Trametes coccinea BRFM310]|uniref:Uncharacterized protein n=1 Tax=Trametes coccinea (strain BRFM310) TaxID=1353009 RepID=A0A1Y2ICH8_TRAC3|nr:hypothetical protein PYCCODRAFT_902896 [Trametes coccinea BRFM310]
MGNSLEDWKRTPTTADTIFGVHLPLRPPKNPVGAYLWRWRVWVETTSGLVVFEPWEKILIRELSFLFPSSRSSSSRVRSRTSHLRHTPPVARLDSRQTLTHLPLLRSDRLLPPPHSRPHRAVQVPPAAAPATVPPAALLFLRQRRVGRRGHVLVRPAPRRGLGEGRERLRARAMTDRVRCGACSRRRIGMGSGPS